MIPISAFGLFELQSVEEFQRSYIPGLLTNLQFHNNKIFYNNNQSPRGDETITSMTKSYQKSQFSENNYINKKKNIIFSKNQDFLKDLYGKNKKNDEIIDNLDNLNEIKDKKDEKKFSPKNKTIDLSRKYEFAITIKKEQFLIEYFDQGFILTIESKLHKFLKKTHEILQIFPKIQETNIKFHILSMKKSFFIYYLPEILKEMNIEIKKIHNNLEIEDNLFFILQNFYQKHYKNYCLLLQIQSNCRKFLQLIKSKTNFKASKSLFVQIYRKVMHIKLYFLFTFYYKSGITPLIVLKVKNLELKNKISFYYWNFNLSILNKELAIDLKKNKMNQLTEDLIFRLRKLCMNLLTNELEIKNSFESDSQLVITPLKENVDIHCVNIKDTIKLNSSNLEFKQISENKRKSLLKSKPKKKLNKIELATLKIQQLFLRIKLRKSLREYKMVKYSKKVKRIFLRTFILRKFANFIRMDVFLQEKGVLLLTFTNLNSFTLNQSKYSLEIYPYSKEMFSKLLLIPVIHQNKSKLNSFLLWFLENILISNLRLDLVFENVYVKLLHANLKLREVTSFNHLVIEGSILSRKIIVMTQAIIAVQRRFRKIKKKERQDLINESSKRKKEEEIFKITYIKRGNGYYRLIVYRRNLQKNEFRFLAHDLDKNEKFYTKYIDFQNDFMNTRGKKIIDYLINLLEIDQKKGIVFNFTPIYDAIPELQEKTVKFNNSTEIHELEIDEIEEEEEIHENLEKNPDITLPSNYVELKKKETKKYLSKISFSPSKEKQKREDLIDSKFIYHTKKNNLQFEMYYTQKKTNDLTKRNILNASQENSLQIDVDLHALKSYTSNFNLDSPRTLKNLTSELSQSLILGENGEVLIDSNKINPNCLNISSFNLDKNNKSFCMGNELISNQGQNQIKGIEDSKQHKEILAKTIKWFSNKKFIVTGAIREKHIDRFVKLGNHDEDFLEDYEVSLIISAYKQNKKISSLLEISFSISEGYLLTKKATTPKEILSKITSQIKVCNEYFIFELNNDLSSEELRKILEISYKNKGKVIFIRKKTLEKINLIASSLKKKLYFVAYNETLKSCKRIFIKKAMLDENCNAFSVALVLNEKGKLAFYVFCMKMWTFIGEIILRNEKYDNFLLTPKKWQRFLFKFWENLQIINSNIQCHGSENFIFDEDKFILGLYQEANLQKIQEIEENFNYE